MKLYFVVTAALSQIGHFSSALSSDTKSVNPIYFFDFAISISRPQMTNFHCEKIFARTSLNGFLSQRQRKEQHRKVMQF